MDQVIKITEEVYAHFGKGDIYSPPKVSLPLQDTSLPGMHWINSMPAFLKYKNIVGIKWVNVTSENRRRGLPVTMGTIILNDAATGTPIAVLDGTWITHMRTGASIAIGAKYFARKDSKVITVVGCGAEGKTGLEATSRFLDFEEVRAVDINKNVREEFVREMAKKTGVNVVPFDNVKDAVRESDIVFLATTAEKPLMLSEWAKPGDFITTVSCFCDIDHRFVETSDKLFLDDTACALGRIRMMTGLEIPVENVYGDITEVAAGKKASRENDKEIITYSPAGMGAVDVGVAFEAFGSAEKKKLGSPFSLGKFGA
jgi:ornithine cyclodeaminase/alanine dehydrogenase-like protein (mu-crystallin family)